MAQNNSIYSDNKPNWMAMARMYADRIYCYPSLVDDHIERFEAAFQAGETPRLTVVTIGDKYDLRERERFVDPPYKPLPLSHYKG